MRFTLRQLEYFIAAGETGSITLASERVHISQPSISTAISHIEKELKVQLFIRHHAQGLSLTSVGREFLREAKNLIGQAEALYTLVSETADQVRGSLSLGCMVTLAPMVVPELAHSFATAFPATQLRHVEGNQEKVIEGLRRSETDLAVTYDLEVPDDVLFTGLADLPAHVLVAESHPLAQRTSLTLDELASEPMILLDLPLSREYFLALFLKTGLRPHVIARSAETEVVRTMVANGYGYTILNVRPRSNLALDGKKLIRVHLAGDHRPMRLGLARLRQLRKSRLVGAFEDHCRALISNDYIPGMVSPALERPAKKV